MPPERGGPFCLRCSHAHRIQEEVPEVGTAAGEDVTEHWFRQKDPRSLRVGRKADYPQSRGGGHSFNSWEFLHHYEGPKELPGPVHPPFEQGLRLTRFKKGMYRRNYRDICQDKERLEKEVRPSSKLPQLHMLSLS